jgi:drug/metabolite transporter (DMT)-like permease
MTPTSNRKAYPAWLVVCVLWGTTYQGVLAAETACVGWAFGSNYARRRGQSGNVLVVAGFEMIFGGLFLVAGGSLRQEWRIVSFTTRTLGAWLYLVFFGGIAGFSAYACSYSA